MLPLLDRQIIFPLKELDGTSVIQGIVEQLTSETSYKVKLGNAPYHLLQSVTYRPRSSQQSARHALSSLLDSTKSAFAWSLLYDMNDHSYVLNLVSVGSYKQGSSGNMHFVAVPR